MNERLPLTELENPSTANLDELSTTELVQLLVREQQSAVEAVARASPQIARAVEEISKRLAAGGRLHYVGAGTSGRIGVLDASEMPPTFGTPPELVCAHIAGGPAAITSALEGAEDNEAAAQAEMHGHVRAGDSAVGISASGGARYVLAAMRASNDIGAFTIGIASTQESELLHCVQLPICVDTRQEPLTGSTRLKAGTAQKVVLNTISTAVMVRLGKTYGNLMVDLLATNDKLRKRALRLVMKLADVDVDTADKLLDSAGKSVKIAVIMHRRGASAQEAFNILQACGGSLRASLT